MRIEHKIIMFYKSHIKIVHDIVLHPKYVLLLLDKHIPFYLWNFY